MKRKVIIILVSSLGIISIAQNTESREPYVASKVPQEEFFPIEIKDSGDSGTENLRFIYPVPTEEPTAPPKPSHKNKARVENAPQAPRTGLGAPIISGARSKAIAQKYALSRVGEAQYSCLYKLWMRESGWRYWAHNKSSGAYGIPQALPGSKMKSAGSDWKTNPITQVKWGLGYIKGRYGSSCEAWRFFTNHGWY